LRVVASVQARMGSSRLPGKVLKVVAGRPLLLWQVERLNASRLVDEVVVATTTNPKDDEIAEMCLQHDVTVFRGSEADVLSRIADLVVLHRADVHVECFGDSPLVDPQIVDEFIGYLLKNCAEVDYVSSALRTTYPPGLETIAYWGWVISEVNKRVGVDDPLREHAGFNATRFPEQVRVRGLDAPVRFREPDTYLEVDTSEDLEVVREVFAHLGGTDSAFGLAAILDFMRGQPELGESNRNVERRWKVHRSDA
jgi:spore coat polysaccharide biosynthesis protein SpsF